MKTLYQLAFDAVPNKGLMAETFLVPWHPVAQQLQAQQYIEDRNKYREQHRVNFRFVYANLFFIRSLVFKLKNLPEQCCVFKSIVETNRRFTLVHVAF